MVYLTGDTHGELDRFRHGKLRWLGKRDVVLVLGDFGFVWDGSKEEQKKLDWLRKRPYTLLFLDGSHENYDLLAQYPTVELFGGNVQALGGNLYHVCRGSVLELEGKKIPLLWRGGKSGQRGPGGRCELVASGDALRRRICRLRGEPGSKQLAGRLCADPRRPKQVPGFFRSGLRREQPPASLP